PRITSDWIPLCPARRRAALSIRAGSPERSADPTAGSLAKRFAARSAARESSRYIARAASKPAASRASALALPDSLVTCVTSTPTAIIGKTTISRKNRVRRPRKLTLAPTSLDRRLRPRAERDRGVIVPTRTFQHRGCVLGRAPSGGYSCRCDAGFVELHVAGHFRSASNG